MILVTTCWFSSQLNNYRKTLQARSQPVFSGKPEGLFCLSCTFIFRNERNWTKKSARVSEKLVSPGARVSEKLVSPGLTWLAGSYAPALSFL